MDYFEIYKQLKTNIEALNIFKEIDLYQNQLELEDAGTGNTLIMPACYIRIEQAPFEYIGNKAQKAFINFDVIVAGYKTLPTPSSTANATIQKAFETLTWLQLIKQELVGKSFTHLNMSSIRSGNEEVFNTVAKYMAHFIRFRARVEDHSTALAFESPTNATSISIELAIKTPGKA